MTGKPTEKMVWRLQKSGYAQADIDLMSYETASAIIGKLPAFHKEVRSPETERIETAGWKVDKSQVYKPKPVYNPASQYVSYSKDIFLELRKMLHEEWVKNPKMEIVSDDVVMARSVQIVKIAIKEFE